MRKQKKEGLRGLVTLLRRDVRGLDEWRSRSLPPNVLHSVSGRKGGRCLRREGAVRSEDWRQGIVIARDRLVRRALEKVDSENGFLSKRAGLGCARPSSFQRCKGAWGVRRVFDTVTRT